MATLKHLTLVVFVGIVCGFCGGHGNDMTSEAIPQRPESPSSNPPVVGMQKTKVDFDTLPYNFASDNDPACKTLENNHRLLNLRQKFHNFERIEDLPPLENWPREALLGSDFSGDHRGNFDFQKIGIGQFNNDLVVVWDASEPLQTKYRWEFGYFSSREKDIHRIIKSWIEITSEEISLISGGTTEILGDQVAQFKSSGGRNILRISFKKIENILAYPHWWIRGMAYAGEQLQDVTAMSIFYSTLNPDYQLFDLSTCWLDLPAPYDLPITIIRDSESMPEEIDSEVYRMDFIRSIKSFVDIHFIQNKFLPQLKTLHQTFFLSRKNILPLESQVAIGRLNDQVSVDYNPIYYGSIIPIANLEPPFDSHPHVSAAIFFDQVSAKHFFFHESSGLGGSLMDAFLVLLEFKGGLIRFGKKYWIDRVTLQLSRLGYQTEKTVQTESLKLAQLLEPYLSIRDIWIIWRDLSRNLRVSGSLEEWQVFLQVLDTFMNEGGILHSLKLHLGGWKDQGSFHYLLDPSTVVDTDRDGLPDNFEIKLGTNPRKRDTDDDDWADSAEWILGKSMLDALEHPAEIVADGIFGDWQKLIPRRILVDQSRTGLCHGEGDINFYASLAQKSALIIGAIAPNLTDNHLIKWEFEFDLPMINKKYIAVLEPKSIFSDLFLQEKADLNSVNSKLVMKIFSGFNHSQNAIEIVFLNRFFGKDIDLIHKEAVRIKVRTRDMENQEICDETEWFSPVQSDLS